MWVPAIIAGSRSKAYHVRVSRILSLFPNNSIELYGVSHEEWLKTFLNLEKGIPSADTYRRVLARLKPEALQACFQG